ncbi:MAG TPA: NAD(P)/FAD-dependent oxidoreductase [Methanoculleus sp.]|nr:NAD(P)/FAD-dependent oxidoreductase [Methanoculleus sp.]
MITVVGGGPAGRTAAIRLAGAGQEVELIDRGGLGGQCLHHGCMVVCALNDAARLLHSARSLADRGVLDHNPALSFPALIRELKETQAIIREVLDRETDQAGVTVIRGAEAFVEGATVVCEGERRHPDALLIATGSAPRIPAIEGIDLPGVHTPHTVLGLDALPRSLAIIGGGAVGAEYAYIFRSFGCEVDLICRSRLLSALDERIGRQVRKDLDGVRIREQTAVCRIEGSPRADSLVLETGGAEEVIGADAVLVAAGLVPRTEMVSGVPTGPSGAILVDASMRTGVPGVYAAGDVTGPPYLTPVARYEGRIAADTILGITAKKDRACIPQYLSLRYDHAFCTLPPDASASFSIPSPSGPGSFWAVRERHTGVSTLDFEPESGRVTGIHAAAPGSAHALPYLAHLIEKGLTLAEFEDLIEVHPSTDAIPWLVRYAADWRRKNGSDG